MPSSLAEESYDLLVHKITRLEVAPGALLVERDLITEFGIGRTPVREALQRLAMERLVNHQPNRGMFVSEITATSVQQIYEFRAMLDGQAAWLAASRATSDQIKELELLQLELVRATKSDAIDHYVDADRQFYRVLAEAAHNAWIADSITRIFNLHLRLWFFIIQRLGSWKETAKAHEEMTRDVVAALAWRDATKAKIAMEAYVARRLSDLKGIL
jgi:DNA-binding GntR family transcriptional regulator